MYTDSLCCVAVINTTLQTNYTSVLKKIKKLPHLRARLELQVLRAGLSFPLSLPLCNRPFKGGHRWELDRFPNLRCCSWQGHLPLPVWVLLLIQFTL